MMIFSGGRNASNTSKTTTQQPIKPRNSVIGGGLALVLILRFRLCSSPNSPFFPGNLSRAYNTDVRLAHRWGASTYLQYFGGLTFLAAGSVLHSLFSRNREKPMIL
ncbi:hypothetical protein I7I50_01987 [Histoplasma capsulatum G186AR]|uniref:Uncharacterized protein n=1 Tax=Ajellomyces capsulatus TaxID=5037 RepID=A0A8H7YC09_AJECA|nr:hypothetical protein I7I52_12201 [Histoplasma capsulatum]QSS71227.1 hypothetical protein I7I50_01987 [Histoplasma capsulatum G186AR]